MPPRLSSLRSRCACRNADLLCKYSFLHFSSSRLRNSAYKTASTKFIKKYNPITKYITKNSAANECRSYDGSMMSGKFAVVIRTSMFLKEVPNVKKFGSPF